MSDSGDMSLKKEYSAMVYDRDYIQNKDIKDLISEVTGIPLPDVDKIIFDGKVTPVIVLNDYNYDNYKLLASWNLGLPALADVHFCSVDNYGNTYFYVHGDSVITYNKDGENIGSWSGLCMDFNLGFGMVDGRHFFARDPVINSFMYHWYRGEYKTRIETGLNVVSPWACSPSGKYFVGCEAGDDDVELWSGALG